MATRSAPRTKTKVAKRTFTLTKGNKKNLHIPNFRDSVGWVFNVIDISNILPSDAPSSGAWSLLEWARLTTTNRSEFYKNFCAKMLPSRKEMSDEEGRRDDGRTVGKATIQMLLKASRDAALRGASAQRDPAELGVPC